MKKILFVLFFVLVIFPVVSSVEINLKENYYKGETFMAKTSGNFLQPLTKQNVFLYEKHIRIPISPSVAKINDNYYIYFQLTGKSEGNYSLVLKDVSYFKSGEISNEDVRKNFTISGTLAQFKLEPGFVVTDDNFSIEIENLQDEKINVEVKVGNSDDNLSDLVSKDFVSVSAGRRKKIYFDYDFFDSIFNKVHLSSDNFSYVVPVFLPSKIEESEKPEVVEPVKPIEPKPIHRGIRIELSNPNVTLIVNTSQPRILHISNLGVGDENINLSVSEDLEPYVNLSSYEIEVPENSSLRVDLDFVSGNEAGVVGGKIIAVSRNFSDEIFVNLKFIEFPSQLFDPPNPPYHDEDDSDYVEEDEFVDGNEPAGFKTCEEMGGFHCEDNQVCNVNETDSFTGDCCIGICEDVEENSLKKVIGFTIIFAVGIFLAWFFLVKYRRTKRRKSDLKRIVDASNDY